MNRIKRAIREWLCAADKGEMLEMSSRIFENSAEASWLEDRIRRLEDANNEAIIEELSERLEPVPVPGKLFMRMRPGS